MKVCRGPAFAEVRGSVGSGCGCGSAAKNILLDIQVIVTMD